MAEQTCFTFIYSNGSSYLSVESDTSKNLLKVSCLGMGMVWGLPDHTWDYSLTSELRGRLEAIEADADLSSWDECYFAAYEPDLEWEFFVDREGEPRKRSFGQGMRAEKLDDLLGAVKSLVMELSKQIFIDLSSLEAVYFCHVANGINCTCTLYRDMESTFEKTKMGEMKLTLTSEMWGRVVALVSDPGLPKFGFRKETGTQFVSRALYLGGKMVSYTYGGQVSSVWDAFEADLIKAIGL